MWEEGLGVGTIFKGIRPQGDWLLPVKMGGQASLLLRGGDGVGALYQGGKKALMGDWLEAAQIGASVSIGSACVDPTQHPGVRRRLWLSVGDNPTSAPALMERMREVVEFVHAARISNVHVLVHCSMGVSRSSAVVVAYAMTTGLVPDAATGLKWLEKKRPQASPNSGLRAALDTWRPAKYLDPPATDVSEVAAALEAGCLEDGKARRAQRWTRIAEAMRANPYRSLRERTRLVDAAVEASELWMPNCIERVAPDELSALEFARDYASRPLVFRTSERLSILELKDACGEAMVTVSATPDGRADAIVTDSPPRFAKPEARTMRLADLVAALDGKTEDVLYYSAQNDCLRTELPGLAARFADPPLTRNHLSAVAYRHSTPCPAAINIWLGDCRSVTTAHRDRAFDNFYLVLHGQKTFYLLPPLAPAWLPSTECIQATWTKNVHDGWFLSDDTPRTTVYWLDADLKGSMGRPEANVSPLVVHLDPGDLLWLPAGWVHEVHQADSTLAVNWWYDARTDDARWAAIHIAAALAGETSTEQH